MRPGSSYLGPRFTSGAARLVRTRHPRHRVGAIKLPFRPFSPSCATRETHRCFHQAGAIKLPKDLAAPSMLLFRGLSIKQN